jgi:hypothetical protein
MRWLAIYLSEASGMWFAYARMVKASLHGSKKEVVMVPYQECTIFLLYLFRQLHNHSLRPPQIT